MKLPNTRRYRIALLCALLALSGLTIYAHRRLESARRAASPSAVRGHGQPVVVKAASKPTAVVMTSTDQPTETALEPLQAGGSYNLTQTLVPGGGGTSTGGSNELTGSAGQSALGASSNGSYSIAGGFWGGGASGGCTTITLSPATLPGGTVGTGYNQTLTASGGAAPYTFTLTAGALPGGLNLTGAGVLSGTPNAGGTFNFTITATDAGSCTGSQAYALTINTSPTINAVAVSRQQGSPASGATIANVSDPDQALNTLTVTVNSGASATVNGVTVSGISVNAAGVVTANVIASCTATNASFTLTVTDSASATANATLNVTVTANPAPTLTYTNASVAAGGALNVSPASATDNGSITGFALVSVTPALTTVPTVTAAGVVVITNAAPSAIHTITIRATDNCGATTDASFTLNVGCPAITVNPASPTLPGGTAGQTYSQTFTASGGAAPYSFSISAGALPNGSTLSSGGALTGTPSAGGSFNFTVTATDASLCTGARAYALVLAPASNLNGKIAFVSDRDGNFNYDIYTMNPDGSQPVNITNNPAVDNQPAWAPNGLKLAFVSERDGNREIYVMNADDSSPVRLTTNGAEDAHPTWSPDGQRIAFESDRDGNQEIYVMNADGSNQMRLTTNAAREIEPNWSPDGLKIAFASDRDGGQFEIYVMNTDGSAQTRLTNNAAEDSQPSWSPDGTKLIFLTNRDGNFQIYAIGANGSNPTNLTNQPNSDGFPNWSPDGAKIVFETSRDGNDEIYVMNADGSSQTRLTTNSFKDYQPAWQRLPLNCATITLSPATLPNGTTGGLYTQTITASGGTAPYTFTVLSGTLPTGLSLSSGGVLSGTPSATGPFNFTIKATDVNGCMGTQPYTLVINCPAITVNPANATLPAGQAGQPYNQTFTQTGGNGTATFAISAGALPSGLSLSTGGVLSGAPAAFGNFSFTVRATDSGGCMGTRAYSLTINPPCATITVNPTTLPGGTVGTAYNQTMAAVGGAGTYSFTISAGTLPSGLSLATSGALTGMPTIPGTFNFTVGANDTNDCLGMRAYTIIIGSSGLMFYPLAHPVRLLDSRVGQSGCFTPGAPIPGGTSRTQPARGVCDGLTIPANAQAITGNITTVQSGGGYLTLYPSDAAQPLVANSNYSPNEIINNVFTVGLGNADGAFKIFVTSNTDVVVDVTGYYAPPSAGGLYFHPLPKPIRLLETRAGFTGCTTPGAPLPGGVDTPQQARLTCDGVTIPSTALAIVGNATTVGPQGPGFPYLTLFPADAARPLVASSNYLPGQVMNAPFTVGLSPTGQFEIYPTTQTHLVIDVLGYYSADATDANGAGLLFNSLPHPVRLLETRAGFTGCYVPGAPLASGSTRTQPTRGLCDGVTIAATALGIVGNATVVNSNGGYLTFWPSGAAQPLVATSNFTAGQVFNRHFTVGLGAGDGAFNIFTQFQTDLVIDVSGYFAP